MEKIAFSALENRSDRGAGDFASRTLRRYVCWHGVSWDRALCDGARAPAWLPPLPWVSWFLELKVRTYVHDARGRLGVWFYSLDCSRALAVAIARRFFHLPYLRARLVASLRERKIHSECERHDENAVVCCYIWIPGEKSAPVAPGSLDFFLVERYLLFAADSEAQLYSGRVHHSPYRVNQPSVSQFSVEPARLPGFRLTGEPVSVLAAVPVDVSIFPLKSATRSSS